jgi:hypothetical protein
MEQKPKPTLNSALDADKYCMYVYYLIHKDHRIRKEDKLDCAHDILKLLLSMPAKLINGAYIKKRARLFVDTFLRRKYRWKELKMAPELKVLATESTGDEDRSQTDWEGLPLTEQEREELIKLYTDSNTEIADAEGLGRSAICMRKKRLLAKIKRRLGEAA